MLKISETDSKVPPAKKNIKLENIQVKDLKFVDESGDITEDVIAALPEGTETVSFKITVELPEENMNNNE